MACSRLWVSEDDQNQAGSAASGERDPAEKRTGRSSPFSLPDPTRRLPALSILHSQRAWNESNLALGARPFLNTPVTIRAGSQYFQSKPAVQW